MLLYANSPMNQDFTTVNVCYGCICDRIGSRNPCECGKVCIGKMSSSMQQRIKEHKRGTCILTSG